MGKYEKLKELPTVQFRRLTGVKKQTFQEMVRILSEEENRRRDNRRNRAGRRHRLTIEDRLLMTLEYLREYRTYFHLGNSYGLSESAFFRACRWLEDVLVKSGRFSLPGKKKLLESDADYEIILIDATESPIEKPKKRVRNKKRIKKRNNKQKHFYSGKKKKHTIKSQVTVCKKSKKVIWPARQSLVFSAGEIPALVRTKASSPGIES